MKKVPTVLQESNADCGESCLASILAYYSPDADAVQIMNRVSTSTRGMTLGSLADQARANGMIARGFSCNVENISTIKFPAIAHWEKNHFVVIEKIDRNNVIYMDPHVGRTKADASTFFARFSGVLLEVFPSPVFVSIKRERQQGLMSLLSSISGARGTIIKIFSIGLFVELVSSLYPLLLQITIGEFNHEVPFH